VTIQAGLTGPPTVPELRVRVWSDRPGADVTVTMARTGAPIPGAVITPRPLPLSAVHPSLPRRVVEISGLPPDTLVRIGMAGEDCTVLTPPAPDGELRVLMGSCFYLPDDRGKLASAYESLRDQDRPHLRLHGGDQLYLDAGALPDAPSALERTHARYRQYWLDPVHSRYLRSGITLFAPDDHDFWNDYPYWMPHLSRSSSDQWVEHARAAQTLYDTYQALGNPDGKSWFSLDLGLVSLFVLDTRSRRGSKDRNPPERLFDPAQGLALRAWSAALTKPGMVLSAMPLFQAAANKILLGLFTTDHNLLAYPADARQIWRAVEGAPYGILVLSGDIHRGIVSEWRTGRPGALRQHYEVVASPLSLLGYPVTPKRKAERQPGGLQLGEDLGRRDVAKTFYCTSTDHFALLRFNRDAQSVRVTASVHRTPDAVTPKSEIEHTDPCKVEFHLRREA
jgi:hypothetical protein